MEPARDDRQEADLVDVRVTTSGGGAVIEIHNLGSKPIRDVVLSDVRDADHSERAWRPVSSEAHEKGTWWRVLPGDSVRCPVELLDGHAPAAHEPSTAVYRVEAFWSDLAGNWWVLTAEGLKDPTSAGTGTTGEVTTGEGTPDEPPDRGPRLTSAEDSEMRQLTWFASLGQLSEESQARLDGLRARDRRGDVRDARPDPTSRQSDQTGPRLDQAAGRSARCGHCGFEATGQMVPSFCPGCGERMPAAQVRSEP